MKLRTLSADEAELVERVHAMTRRVQRDAGLPETDDPLHALLLAGASWLNTCIIAAHVEQARAAVERATKGTLDS